MVLDIIDSDIAVVVVGLSRIVRALRGRFYNQKVSK